MKKNCPGFTLIELLLIFSLMSLLFSLGIAQYNRFNRRQSLEKAKDELISNLRLAQSKSLAGEKPADCDETENLLGHELEFIGIDSYHILAVCGSEPYPEVKGTVLFPEGVTKTSGDDVFFRGLSQGVESESNIELSGFGETRNITVTTTGEINEN